MCKTVIRLATELSIKPVTIVLIAVLTAGCQSTYLVRGEGGTPCATAVRQMQQSEQARHVYGAWLSGYLTRYNYERDSKLSRDFKSETLVDAAIQYCNGKPLDDFSQAAEEVVKELQKKN